MSEFLGDLFKTFHDRLEHDGKQEVMIKCKICCLKAPAASTNSAICEMCYEDDFWDWVANQST